jgi:hypothetical protein
VLFCHFSDHFSAKKSPYNLEACFTQNTRLTPTAKLRNLGFTHLSTNLCRDFFCIFLTDFPKFRTHNFCPLADLLEIYFQKNHFSKLFRLLTSYAAGIKHLEFLKNIFLEKKDFLVEIHFGHLFLSILEKSRVVLFLGKKNSSSYFLFVGCNLRFFDIL